MTDAAKPEREPIWKIIPLWAPLAVMIAGGLVAGVSASVRLNDDHATVAKDVDRIQALETQRAVDQRMMDDHTRRLDRIECKLDRMLEKDSSIVCGSR